MSVRGSHQQFAGQRGLAGCSLDHSACVRISCYEAEAHKDLPKLGGTGAVLRWPLLARNQLPASDLVQVTLLPREVPFTGGI